MSGPVVWITWEGETEEVSLHQVDRVTGLPGLASLLQDLRAKPGKRDDCPRCGKTLDQVRKSGLLGCPLCYSVLLPQLAQRQKP
ncbi:MAG: hypothetical protein KIT11_09235 [Fimbriimonadaceae bacterium]|nr:hypothetical protein [Fimbriimonadaceae bacterium]QYK55511.1 MAG: hypothetical protein KF733_10905 [Fimbriimonadaceae bacterium]